MKRHNCSPFAPLRQGRILLLLALACSLPVVAFVVAQDGAPYEVAWFTSDGGGGTSSGGGYTVSGTAGQPDAGLLSGGDYALIGGFRGLTAVSEPIAVGPLMCYDQWVDDDTTGDSEGNDDSVVDCGETIELYVALLNQGDGTALGVEAVISTTDTCVTVTNGQEGYSDVPTDTLGVNADGFVFEVDADTPDGHAIHVDLTITASNGGPWSESFDIPVTCTGAETDFVYLPLIVKLVTLE